MNAIRFCSCNAKTAKTIFLKKNSNTTFLNFFNNFNYASFRFCSESAAVPVSKSNADSPLDTVKDLDLSTYGSIMLPTYNFAAYADKNPLFQELIKLGVELYKIEKDPNAAQYIFGLNYERNVKAHLQFLHINGVPPDKLGNFITSNPYIFKECLDDLETRINYLKSKRFSQGMISEIITKCPKWLSIPVKKVDERLGYLQQTLQLKGDEVRKIITSVPSLIYIQKKRIISNVYILQEEMQLSNNLIKKLVLEVPAILRKDEYEVMNTYEYITKIMQVPSYLVIKQPKVLLYRKHIVQDRHKFLIRLGRAQYNPLQSGYVPLLELFTLSDEEFCSKHAMVSVLTFNEFLKSL